MPALTHDAHGLLWDIITHPDDDTPRHIYADWLEDNDCPGGAWVLRSMLSATGERLAKVVVFAGDEHTVHAPLEVGGGMTWRAPPDAELTITRGFPSALACTLAAWMGENGVLGGKAWVRRYPLERVRTVDRHPYALEGGLWRWLTALSQVSAAHDAALPTAVHDLLPLEEGGLPLGCYSSEDNARGALSEACLAWAWAQDALIALQPPGAPSP